MINLSKESTLFLSIYILIAILTFLPVLFQLIRTIPKSKNAEAIESAGIDEWAAKTLKSRISRDEGALSYWRKYIYFCKGYKYYAAFWITIIGIFIPIVTQFSGTEENVMVFVKVILTVISLHSAIVLAFNRVLKIDSNYNTYRTAAANYSRNLNLAIDNIRLDVGKKDQYINTFITDTQNIRKTISAQEAESIPHFETKEK